MKSEKYVEMMDKLDDAVNLMTAVKNLLLTELENFAECYVPELFGIATLSEDALKKLDDAISIARRELKKDGEEN